MKHMQNTNKKIIELIKRNGEIRLSEISPELIASGKNYISNLDLSQIVLDGPIARFDEISSPMEMVSYLSSRRKILDLSEEYISHYTNIQIVRKIVAGRKFQLGNPRNMNDGLEFSSPQMDSSKIYFASFSIENGENIGMWSMYGQPWENGVKISIPKKLFIEWADQIKRVYHVDPVTFDINTENAYGENEFKSSVSRVAYVEWNAEGNITQIRCGEKAKNTKLGDVDSQILTGFIKDIAWSYEKEIRLRVDMSHETTDTKVAIDIPDEIIKNIVITTGPRFKGPISELELEGVAEIRKSIFTGKLNYVYCDKCKQ